MQTGKFGSKFISANVDRSGALTSLFQFEDIRNKSTLTVFDLQEDIERLFNLKQTAPEQVFKSKSIKSRFGGREFVTVETTNSLNARRAVQRFNAELSGEISQREKLLAFLQTKPPETSRDTIGGAPQLVNFEQTSYVRFAFCKRDATLHDAATRLQRLAKG